MKSHRLARAESLNAMGSWVWLLGLALTAPLLRAEVTDTAPTASAPAYLWVQDSGGGSLTGPDDQHLTLTLRHLRAYVTRFTDRPFRDAAVAANVDFYARWPKWFVGSAPNAVLSYRLPGASRMVSIVLTLSDPRFDAAHQTVTYSAVRIRKSVDVLPDTTVPLKPPFIPNPQRFGSASLFIDSATGSGSPSLCDDNIVCMETLSVLNTDKSTFDNYFTAVDGYHVGPHEYQGYFPQQVEFVTKSNTDEDPSYWQLSAVPVAAYPCIGRGDVDPGNRVLVSLGTCTYHSGAFYSHRKGFYVNKDSQGKTIEHGGIEIKLKINKENRDLTMDQLYQKGAWPAVWMMPDNLDDTFRFNAESFAPKKPWPAAMEIDILELINGGWTRTTPIIGSLHYGYQANKTETSWNYLNNIGDYDRPILPLYPVADSDHWHTYGFTWQKSERWDSTVLTTSFVLSWYYDGNKYTSVTISRQYSARGDHVEYFAEREVNGTPQLLWCTSSSPRCCTIESNRCNLTLAADTPMPLSEAEVMFNSLSSGFDSGYYLNVNLAAGGDGIGVYDSALSGFPPPSFGTAAMQISSIKRFIIK